MKMILKKKLLALFSPTSQQKPWYETHSLQYQNFCITLYMCFFFATVVVARGRWCWLKATIIMSMISLNGHYDKPNAQADFIMQI